MTTIASRSLPANPYTRQPIRKAAHLAGRARELKSVRYYLGLTANGQSPHLALIGQRGVGKTSLLNGATDVATELKLLPIRLDMNERKTASPGHFWHDLYSALVLAMARAGCWGGTTGVIYGQLFGMIHARQPGEIEKAVLQIPVALSCHHGNLDTFECADALVTHDLEECIAELDRKGLTGIAFLLDEADCLGQNVPLLQMFRNVFQAVDRCSLLLAGTDAVFPAISEVFSPIPRQFYRIDVRPFANWSETLQLVLRALPTELIKTTAPEYDDIEDLHNLCGGDPSEVQLYCHHMYRSVEDGVSTRMSLAPKVFREVLGEYRANMPANTDSVLNAIEKLPDELLHKSQWLSRRALTLEENICVEQFRRELAQKTFLSKEDSAAIMSELQRGYQRLFADGIIETNNRIQLAGAPLTAGFWKSFVQAERGARWTWDDAPYAECLLQPIAHSIVEATDSVAYIPVPSSDDAVPALEGLRRAETIAEFTDGMAAIIVTAILAADGDAEYAVDVLLQVDSPAGRQVTRNRFLERPGDELRRTQIVSWVDGIRPVLSKNSIVVELLEFKRWKLPSIDELDRLGQISEFQIPDAIRARRLVRAVRKFGDGDIRGCANQLAEILNSKESAEVRNNLAFCQLFLGEIDKGFQNSTRASAADPKPLYQMNRGIAEVLSGDIDSGIASFRQALSNTRSLSSSGDLNRYS